MASRIARKEWMRGLPSAIGEGRYERKLVHSASERSVGYVFLIEESVQNHPNPHPYQTGSKTGGEGAFVGIEERLTESVWWARPPPAPQHLLPADIGPEIGPEG